MQNDYIKQCIHGTTIGYKYLSISSNAIDIETLYIYMLYDMPNNHIKQCMHGATISNGLILVTVVMSEFLVVHESVTARH